MPKQVASLTAATERSLATAGIRPRAQAETDDQIRALLSEPGAAGTGEAYALFELGPGKRLQGSNPTLAGETSDALWAAVTAAGDPQRARAASDAAARSLDTASASLGDTTVGRATVVADAGVIVFREGLEAVLLLAAIMGLGWAPATPTSFDIGLAWGRWLGLYPTWEGIAGQLAAIVVVYGSYAAARGLQRRRRKRVLNARPA